MSGARPIVVVDTDVASFLLRGESSRRALRGGLLVLTESAAEDHSFSA